ncbi:hypothetical protein PT201_08235 [Erysipelothrix rhusiopathiae]|nr:hypothetical protein [Erysipelothrix rhusiopathiae]
MQRILERIKKKELQIQKLEDNLKKRKDELKILIDEKDKKELANVVQILKEKNISASELKEILYKESRAENEK